MAGGTGGTAQGCRADRGCRTWRGIRGTPAGGVRFTVGLELIDVLGRLIDMLAAHGDMVMAAEEAELANGTLAQQGQAIRDGASAVREIVSQIDAQRPDQAPQSHTTAVLALSNART